MREDNSTTGVLMPVGNVVDFVVVNNPGIGGCAMFLDFLPCKLEHLFVALGMNGTVSSFTHCSVVENMRGERLRDDDRWF